MAGVQDSPFEAQYIELQERLDAAARQNQILEEDMTFEYCEMVTKSRHFTTAGKPTMFYCCAHECYHRNEDGLFLTSELKTTSPKTRVCRKLVHSSVKTTPGKVVAGTITGMDNVLGKKFIAKTLKLKFVETPIEGGVRRSTAQSAPLYSRTERVLAQRVCFHGRCRCSDMHTALLRVTVASDGVNRDDGTECKLHHSAHRCSFAHHADSVEGNSGVPQARV